LLLAVGRQDGDDNSDEDADLQNGHGGLSNPVPIPCIMDSRPISTNCLMQAEKLRSIGGNFYICMGWRRRAAAP
jgi:hypothetical protein